MEPSSKRRKLPACFPCYEKHRKCDGESPCSACTSRNIECFYQAHAPRKTVSVNRFKVLTKSEIMRKALELKGCFGINTATMSGESDQSKFVILTLVGNGAIMSKQLIDSQKFMLEAEEMLPNMIDLPVSVDVTPLVLRGVLLLAHYYGTVFSEKRFYYLNLGYRMACNFYDANLSQGFGTFSKLKSLINLMDTSMDADDVHYYRTKATKLSTNPMSQLATGRAYLRFIQQPNDLLTSADSLLSLAEQIEETGHQKDINWYWTAWKTPLYLHKAKAYLHLCQLEKVEAELMKIIISFQRAYVISRNSIYVLNEAVQIAITIGNVNVVRKALPFFE